MLETIVGIGGLVSGTVLPLADRIFGAAERAKALNLSFDVKMKALYFEVTTNLRTLAVVDCGKLTPRNLAPLAASLELETCAAILFSDDKKNAEVKDFLALKGKIEVEDEEVEKPAGNKQKSVLQAMLFIVQRVIALQKIAAVYTGEESALIAVRIPVRVKNLKEHLEFLRKKLREFNKEKQFLFEE
ncbi:MAG: hypothetical protein LBQ57_10370 [Spirochaetales bacterium]|jgi:hypothetical protein|nr:hypothetical protein [Spirochaetales bacterium]